MKTREYELIPETCEERDAVKALRSAINDYAHGYHAAVFAFGGDGMNRTAPANEINHIRELLEAVETDESGRDGNGLDIEAALRMLGKIQGI